MRDTECFHERERAVEMGVSPIPEGQSASADSMSICEGPKLVFANARSTLPLSGYFPRVDALWAKATSAVHPTIRQRRYGTSGQLPNRAPWPDIDVT